jgi:hypothetical protein
LIIQSLLQFAILHYTLARNSSTLAFTAFPSGGQPEYRMTKLDGFDMTGNKETFLNGATAYRNTRDLARIERNGAIGRHNQRGSYQMSAPSLTTTFTESRTSRSTPLVGGSYTSEDELARG